MVWQSAQYGHCFCKTSYSNISYNYNHVVLLYHVIIIYIYIYSIYICHSLSTPEDYQSVIKMLQIKFVANYHRHSRSNCFRILLNTAIRYPYIFSPIYVISLAVDAYMSWSLPSITEQKFVLTHSRLKSVLPLVQGQLSQVSHLRHWLNNHWLRHLFKHWLNPSLDGW